MELKDVYSSAKNGSWKSMHGFSHNMIFPDCLKTPHRSFLHPVIIVNSEFLFPPYLGGLKPVVSSLPFLPLLQTFAILKGLCPSLDVSLWTFLTSGIELTLPWFFFFFFLLPSSFFLLLLLHSSLFFFFFILLFLKIH